MNCKVTTKWLLIKNLKLRVMNCDTCLDFFHVKCADIMQQAFLEMKTSNHELYLEIENKSTLINSKPIFTIQSLLDEMPGQTFETDEFMSESISKF